MRLYVVSLIPAYDPAELPVLVATSQKEVARFFGLDRTAVTKVLARKSLIFGKYQIEVTNCDFGDIMESQKGGDLPLSETNVSRETSEEKYETL